MIKCMKITIFSVLFFITFLTICFAGQVNSKYDVTFGGYLKYDFGYNTQNSSVDISTAARKNSFYDQYSNTVMSDAETRLNFLVKGPDFFGAKTTAFIEGDFRGVTTGNSYGGFQLRHAFIKINWIKSELMIGQNWIQFGSSYYQNGLGINDFVQYFKGNRLPQIAFRYFWSKEFNTMIGLVSATEWSGCGETRQYNDGYARSGLPGIMGEIAFWSDRFGKIGKNNLKMGLGAYYGKEKKTFPTTLTSPIGYQDAETNAWITVFRYIVPIIPDKQNNKRNALQLTGNFFYGQNWDGNDWMSPKLSNGSYWRSIGNEIAAPTAYGLLSQLSYWITNDLSINLLYGLLNYNYSSAAKHENPNLVQNNQSYAINMMWDASQAIRFGIQWENIYTRYNDSISNSGNTGKINQFLFSTYYFF